MTEAPFKIVAAPTAAESQRLNVVSTLRDVLADAEAGKITAVLILSEYIDGDWGQNSSGSLKLSETIGRLEISKSSMITRYLEGDR